MRRTAFCLLFWLCSCLIAEAAPAQYSVTDIGPCGRQNLVINDHGQIAGSYPGGWSFNVGTGTPGVQGFLWTRGKRTNLGFVPSYGSTIVCALNNRGQVAGNLDATTDGAVLTIASHAFLWKQGKLHDLGAPPRR